MSEAQIRSKIIAAGIKNLKEFGYPGVTKDNILTDYLFRKFFKGMLEEDENRLPPKLDHIRLALIAEIDAAPPS